MYRKTVTINKSTHIINSLINWYDGGATLNKGNITTSLLQCPQALLVMLSLSLVLVMSSFVELFLCHSARLFNNCSHYLPLSLVTNSCYYLFQPPLSNNKYYEL
jgi:hypothetical protein